MQPEITKKKDLYTEIQKNLKLILIANIFFVALLIIFNFFAIFNEQLKNSKYFENSYLFFKVISIVYSICIIGLLIWNTILKNKKNKQKKEENIFIGALVFCLAASNIVSNLKINLWIVLCSVLIELMITINIFIKQHKETKNKN